MQESNQRRWHRGGADREAYRGCFYQLAYFPGFEPPFLLRCPASSLPYRLRHLPTAATRSSRFFRRRRRSSRSPYVPLPALDVRLFLIYFPKTDNRWIEQTQAVPVKTTGTRPSTGAGWGSGGGRLKVGPYMLDSQCANERLCGQRIPQPLSLVHFLCGHKK